MPELMTGTMTLMEDGEEQIPILAFELVEYDARLQVDRVCERLWQLLERLTRSVMDVAAPGAPLDLRPAVRKGIVAVPGDDVVDVARWITASPKAGAMRAP